MSRLFCALVCLFVLSVLGGVESPTGVGPVTLLSEDGKIEQLGEIAKLQKGQGAPWALLAKARMEVVKKPETIELVSKSLCAQLDQNGLGLVDTVSLRSFSEAWEIGWWWVQAKRYDEAMQLGEAIGKKI